jgi:hypothetical protein
VQLSETWAGRATYGYPPGSTDVPDDYVFPPVPTGRLYMLSGIKQVAVNAVPKSWKQAFFAYSKAFNGPPYAWTPNLDSLCGGKLEPGTLTGAQRIVGGGPSPSAPDSTYESWQPWTRALPCTSALLVQTGGSVGVGNTVETEVRYWDAGPALEVKFVGSAQIDTAYSLKSNPVPSGKKWLLETAFLHGSKSYGGTIRRVSDGLVLASHAPGTPNQSSGGYSEQQCSLPLGGTQTVWPEYMYLRAGDQIEVEFEVPEPADVAHFVVAAELAA